MQLIVRNVDFEFFEKNLAKCYNFDFPKDERCPIDKLKILHLERKIEILSLFNEDLLCGYAILLLNAGKNNCMLWYLAISEEYRNMGFGTEFLKILQNKLAYFDNVIIEVERRNCGTNENDNTLREKRFNFYEKAGMKLSELKVHVYGVDYEIFLFKQCRESIDTLFEIYKEIYYNVRSKEHIDKIIVKVL